MAANSGSVPVRQQEGGHHARQPGVDRQAPAGSRQRLPVRPLGVPVIALQAPPGPRDQWLRRRRSSTSAWRDGRGRSSAAGCGSDSRAGEQEAPRLRPRRPKGCTEDGEKRRHGGPHCHESGAAMHPPVSPKTAVVTGGPAGFSVDGVSARGGDGRVERVASAAGFDPPAAGRTLTAASPLRSHRRAPHAVPADPTGRTRPGPRPGSGCPRG